MRIDSHQHFWHFNANDYPWMTDKLDAIRQNMLPSDLIPLLDAAGFDACVAVQARQSEAETDYLLGLAARNNRIKGVVGWVDLCAANVADRLGHFAQNPLLKGIRHQVHDEPDIDFILRADFQRGIATLAQFDLAYDLLIRPEHLPNAIRLVRRFPNQRFVIDHIAKPLIKEQVFTPWEEHIRELGRFENVYCKLSGLVTEADWDNWQPEDIHPYLEIAINAFDTNRLMIGSDWGVCSLAGEYVQVMKLVLDFIAEMPEDVQEKITGINCARFYGIE